MRVSEGTVRVAVIGSGGIARGVHLPSLSAMDDVEIVAICDLIESRAREQAAKYGVQRTYALFRDMFAAEDIDAVFALVEPGNMFHVAWACLDAGYPTFIEKPPGITAYQTRSLARKADAAGTLLQVGFNRRFIPAVRRAREIVLERTRVTQVEGCFLKFGRAAFDKGSLSSFASDTVHAVDLIRWLAGAERAEKVATVTAQYDDEVTNAWNGVCLFDNGVTGIIKANYRVGGRVHQFQMHGPGVSAFMDCGCGAPAASATILAHKGEEKYSLASAGAADEGCIQFDSREMVGSEDFHRYYGFFGEDRHFIDCVKSGIDCECNIHEAVKSMELVEAFVTAAL